MLCVAVSYDTVSHICIVQSSFFPSSFIQMFHHNNYISSNPPSFPPVSSRCLIINRVAFELSWFLHYFALSILHFMTEFFTVFVACVASVSESRANGEEHGPSAVHRVLRGQTGQL